MVYVATLLLLAGSSNRELSTSYMCTGSCSQLLLLLLLLRTNTGSVHSALAALVSLLLDFTTRCSTAVLYLTIRGSYFLHTISVD
jgi:hypothetical protein